MRDQIVKTYLWLLVISLPMDWFGPTGALLREAGAKPAIPLMMAASIWLLAARYGSVVYTLPIASWLLTCRFFGIFVCGFCAFALNLIFGWSRFGGNKNPLTQFLTQAALLAITPFIIVMHAELFRDRRWSDYVLRVLPWAAVIHLTALALEVIGALRYNHIPLSLFRTGSEITSMRLAGMFSEPSYFGTMAAIYGVPLILAAPIRRTNSYRLLATGLFAAALYTGGKTVIPVTICGFIGYMWYSRMRLFTLRNILIMLAVMGISLGIIVSRAALDVQENLSSAMRFGSTITSVNAAIAGYGITGVGFGQFHFMFLKKFMPSFLLFSEEAVIQMASSAEHRTSTYNLFTRFLIETGFVGLLLFLACIRDLYRLARTDQKAASLLGILFISTSLGFLFTQEPYCYPPLMLGAALVIGARNERLPKLARAVR